MTTAKKNGRHVFMPAVLVPTKKSDLLANTRRLAGQITKIIKLRSPHVALAIDLDPGDGRAVQREHAFHALAVGGLAHRERGVVAAVAARDHHALEGLEAFAFAFLHLHVHGDGIARRKRRNLFVRHHPRFQLLHDLAHFSTPDSLRCSCRNSSSSCFCSLFKGNRSSKSGRRNHVRPSDCFSRQRRILAWSPDNNTSGTFRPPYSSGRV